VDKNDNKPRKRGGASMPCPKCNSVTRVVQTRRDEDEIWRDRECHKGHHRFWTREVIASGTRR
jgi:transcriptional regulator NrdR family protein